MRNLVVLGIVGLVAQLVDGALGMAYGVTSTTLLLAVGLTPALASTVVHISETGTTLASGISHWRFGNVDWSKVLWLAIPGAIGAVLGTYVLSSVLDAAVAEPIVAIFLFLLGGYVLFRFAFNRTANVVNNLPIPRTFLARPRRGLPRRGGRRRVGADLHPHPALLGTHGAAQGRRHR